LTVFVVVTRLSFVMPGYLPGIRVFGASQQEDGRDKLGHDE
jgi:hypothetical protein